MCTQMKNKYHPSAKVKHSAGKPWIFIFILMPTDRHSVAWEEHPRGISPHSWPNGPPAAQSHSRNCPGTAQGAWQRATCPQNVADPTHVELQGKCQEMGAVGEYCWHRGGGILCQKQYLCGYYGPKDIYVNPSRQDLAPAHSACSQEDIIHCICLCC